MVKSIVQIIVLLVVFGRSLVWAGDVGNLEDPETVIRRIVKANAEMDLPVLEKYMEVEGGYGRLYHWGPKV